MGAENQNWIPFVATLEKSAVLRVIDPERLPKHEEGWLVIPCADGHRFRNLWEYHLRKCGHGPCHHPLTELGGALVLGDKSPLANSKRGFSVDEPLIDKIEASLEFKGLRNIAAYTHFPCSAANAVNLSAEEQFELFASAVERLRSRFENAYTLGFCHLHYPDDRFKTFFADIRLYRSVQVSKQ